jgi:hypothetical protein
MKEFYRKRGRFVDLTGVCVTHRIRERGSRQPKRTALIAEEKTPSTDKRAYAPVACKSNRSGSRNHDDARFSGKCAGKCVLRIVYERKGIRRKVRRAAMDAAFVTADTCDDRSEARGLRKPRMRNGIGECIAQCVVQTRGIPALPDFVARTGAAASENISALVRNNGDGATLAAVYAGIECHGL